MKKMLFLIGISLLSLRGMAQDTVVSSPNKDAWINKPDVIIKAEELRNFPSGKLMEALLGRLPGLNQRGLAFQRMELLFVVDGFVWDNIDVININNIEEVAYYRGGLGSKFGIWNSRDGVLLISTKTAGLNQSLSTDVNVQAGVSSFKENGEQKHNYPQSYHVALSQGLDKLAWRGSATYRSGYFHERMSERDAQLQLSGNLRYEPLKWLSLGANANYAPYTGNELFTSANKYSTFQLNNKRDQKNWNGLFTVRARPVKGLVNEFSLLKDNSRSDNGIHKIIGYIGEGAGASVYSDSLFTARKNSLSILNNLNYSFKLDQERVTFKGSAIYQYVHANLKDQLNHTIYSVGGTGETGSNEQQVKYGTRDGETRVHSWIGDFSVNLYDILFLQTGIRRDKVKPMDKALYSPYYSGRVNLKNAFLKEVVVIDEVSLFASFGKYRNPVSVAQTGFWGDGSMIFPNADQMKMQNYGINTAFFNNRFHLSADWYRNETYATVLEWSLSGGEPTGIFLPVREKGWRIWSSAGILRNTPFKWSTGLSLYRNDMKKAVMKGIEPSANNEINRQGLQMGMQHQFYYRDFSLDINGYTYLNQHITTLSDPRYRYSPKIQERSSYLNLNYIALGYDIAKQKSSGTFKNLKVSVIGRNLIQYRKKTAFERLPGTFALSVNATL
ncbi:TonB-dependent receptor [Pedobacter caeni]|uniref:Uncharacterized protein n=1 Tax=Pedobacter caeni TaxID=288992 RepID=A0A1M5NDQ3_9SPHI|nr:hypothetical protein [Pedobacter caeni]SHG87638.1 hypothetical protein SAMN04488522_108101 [Pedobacter caeni]